jgi:hypothetical protein
VNTVKRNHKFTLLIPIGIVVGSRCDIVSALPRFRVDIEGGQPSFFVISSNIYRFVHRLHIASANMFSSVSRCFQSLQFHIYDTNKVLSFLLCSEDR